MEGLYTATPTATSQPITEIPLLILVGVTGVGKSTTVEALESAGMSFALLPNRRTLTDEFIIRYLQEQNGETVAPVKDRAQRFNFTRAYRRQHPGGMAHVLSRLHIEPTALGDNLLLFDGLRGENEVQHAAELLPRAKFLVLTASDFTRIQRLLGRSDSFDQIAMSGAMTLQLDPAIQALLSEAEQQALTNWVMAGDVDIDAVNAKCQIVAKERNNYDPDAALAKLQSTAPERTIHADTEALNPAQIADLVLSHF